jgi:hypothetical protein
MYKEQIHYLNLELEVELGVKRNSFQIFITFVVQRMALANVHEFYEISI